ncbi:MAG: hypothetical protein ABSC77_02910 [Terracidiphilus sp.]
MKSAMSKNEIEMRSRFDFSRATRGRFSDRYEQDHSVTLLDGDPDMEDPLDLNQGDSQLTEVFGKNLLISHLVAAGFEVAQPVRDKGVDLVVYKDGENAKDYVPCLIQLKASSQESFSLDKKYERFPHLLIAYVWNVRTPAQSDVYALTFKEALQVMEKKGYSKTDSWMSGGYYFVRNAGVDLKKILEPYKMTPKRWREKLQSV